MNLTRFRTTATLFAFALLAPFAATAARAADAPVVNVRTPAEAEVLAKGYADAFSEMSNTPVFIIYERSDKGFNTLAGIRSVRAFGGVVVIRLDRGPMIALPASSIVTMTDERPSN